MPLAAPSTSPSLHRRTVAPLSVHIFGSASAQSSRASLHPLCRNACRWHDSSDRRPTPSATANPPPLVTNASTTSPVSSVIATPVGTQDEKENALDNTKWTRLRRSISQLFRSTPPSPTLLPTKAGPMDIPHERAGSSILDEPPRARSSSLFSLRRRARTQTSSPLHSAISAVEIRLIDMYEPLGREIGSGASGSVSLYRDRISDETVAVKTFRVARAGESHVRLARRIQREINIAQLMSTHANIGDVLAVFQDAAPGGNRQGGRQHLVMPFYPRELFALITAAVPSPSGDATPPSPSAKYVPPPPIPACIRHRIIRQLVSAVAHLHRHGIAHRDIKLENICLDHDDSVRLIDFGSSLQVDMTGDVEDRLTTGVFGSDPYIAPEMFRSTVTMRAYDPLLADAWSTGVVSLSLVRRSFLWDRAELDDRGYRVIMKSPERMFVGLEAEQEALGLADWERELILGLLVEDATKRTTILDAESFIQTRTVELARTA